MLLFFCPVPVVVCAFIEKDQSKSTNKSPYCIVSVYIYIYSTQLQQNEIAVPGFAEQTQVLVRYQDAAL